MSDLVKIQTDLARHDTEIKNINSRLDMMHTDIKEMGQRMDTGFEKVLNRELADAKKNTGFFRSWVFKLIMALVGAGTISAGTAGLVKAFSDNTVQDTQTMNGPG